MILATLLCIIALLGLANGLLTWVRIVSGSL